MTRASRAAFGTDIRTRACRRCDTGNQFTHWKNNLFLGALAAQELRRMVVHGHSVTHQEILFKNIGRVRDVVNGPDGYTYVVLNQPDRIDTLRSNCD